MLRTYKSTNYPALVLVSSEIGARAVFLSYEVVGMPQSICRKDTEHQVDTTRSSKLRDGGFFTPVANEVFLCKKLTLRSRQILLILECKAGTSRLAKLSHREIAQLTGYPLRTIERSLSSLKALGYVAQAGPGEIELLKSIPTEHYVQVYDGVVHHPSWVDWQKHLLLFVMSQFRGYERDFGIPLYTLNFFGRKGTSIERCCRIPGKVKERRLLLRQFVKQLQQDGIMSVVADSTSNRPAICCVSRDVLERINPVYDKPGLATIPLTGSGGKKRCRPKRSITVKRNAATSHSSRSSAVTENAAVPSSETHVKDSKDSEASAKIPESPRSAVGRRGAISSRFKAEVIDGDEESGAENTSSDQAMTGYGDDLAELMTTRHHQRLTAEIEKKCCDVWLVKSRTDRRTLASLWELVLSELPNTITADDVELAIRSAEFQGLDARSWGLLLSDKYRTRFAIEVRKKFEGRIRQGKEAEDRYANTKRALRSSEAAERVAAVRTLATSYTNKPEALLLVAVLVSRKNGDPDASVRLAAIERLNYLCVACEVPDEYVRRLQKIGEYRLAGSMWWTGSSD
ncbi:MAG: hypothetical protein RIK87_23470 [Fuerstiella sp.]